MQHDSDKFEKSESEKKFLPFLTLFYNGEVSKLTWPKVIKVTKYADGLMQHRENIIG